MSVCRRPTGSVRIVLRRQPGGDRLVVVLGFEQALVQPRPETSLAAVELGRQEEFLEGHDRCCLRDHLRELRWLQLAAGHRHMAANANPD